MAVAASAAVLALSSSPATAAPSVSQLHGTLVLSRGTCNGGHPSGSFLSVTFGTRAIRNPRSSCEDGAVTLLSPGRGGLSTQQFSPSGDEQFNGHGNATADTITAPASFGRHRFGIVTSARNLQDAARGPATFSLPKVYVSGTHAYADLRSVQILYGGIAGSTCASASGYGCWLVGAERATGTYDAATHRLSLSWFTGQSFVPASAGTAVHLSGVFHGVGKSLRKGSVVELGTSSFNAGVARPLPDSTSHRDTPTRLAADGTRHHRARRGGTPARSGAAVAADSEATSTGSPRTFLIGELVVALNVFSFFVVTRRRRHR